jgi:hypothetical protein
MDKANATTKSFGDKIGDFAKKAGIALAAAGAAAGANGYQDWQGCSCPLLLT